MTFEIYYCGLQAYDFGTRLYLIFCFFIYFLLN